jgi:hypothetical protein
MFKQQFIILILVSLFNVLSGQEVVKVVTLAEVDISAITDDFDTQKFISIVHDDTSFYLAFKAMNYYPALYKGWLKVFRKGDKQKGEIERIAKRHKENRIMWVTIEEETTNGKIKRKNGEFKYRTAEAWNEVFFPQSKQQVSLVGHRDFERQKDQSNAEKHRNEVKQMMFSPGTDVVGVPFIGDKMGIFDPEMQPYYSFSVYPGRYKDSIDCWIFEAEAKPEYKRSKTVIKNLITWFNIENYDVMKREYTLEYYSIPIDFYIKIEVQNQYYKGVLLPEDIKYDGFFDVPFLKKENIEFELYDFEYLH